MLRMAINISLKEWVSLGINSMRIAFFRRPEVVITVLERKELLMVETV